MAAASERGEDLEKLDGKDVLEEGDEEVTGWNLKGGKPVRRPGHLDLDLRTSFPLRPTRRGETGRVKFKT